MDKTLKEQVLERCEKIAPENDSVVRFGSGNCVIVKYESAFQNGNDQWVIRNEMGNIKVVLSLFYEETDDCWPLAAKILGIEDDPIPSDELLREAIKQGFMWSGHIKDEREEAWNEWLANVKR